MQKKHNIIIRSFAFDGDTTYMTLHRNFFYFYMAIIFERKNVFNIHLNVQRVDSDPLHLYKRLRYRLLSCIIHCGFTNGKPFIDIEKVRDLLDDLPSVVFENNVLTKMHDVLPLLLFSPQNVIKLFRNGLLIETTFWFPIECSIIAFDNDSLN